eukprot:g365.t1
MRPAFHASVAGGIGASANGSGLVGTNSASSSVTPGNLIGRSLESANDVKDAKLAIRRAQLEMQRLRNARAEMEREEEANAAEHAESKMSNVATTKRQNINEVPPILDGATQMQTMMVGSKQRLAGRLAGVPEMEDDRASSASGSSPLLSRRSDTEESRVRDEERRQILFFNDGDAM